MSSRQITVAHSPDSDDAFMFYALAKGKLETDGLTFVHTLADIETLNRKALGQEYDVTAVSVHAYAYLADNYALLSSGASMGERYGPILVAPHPLDLADLRGKTVAVPGMMTTAYLVLRLCQPEVKTVVVPFDQIGDAVIRGEVAAGLVIHEGQLTYAAEGLYKVLDLGEWWFQQTGLPLPLGANAIRRALGPELISQVGRLLKQSIQYALDHRQEALAYALTFAPDLDSKQADRFVGMYVNKLTLDYGPQGRRAVKLLIEMGYDQKVIPRPVKVEFVA